MKQNKKPSFDYERKYWNKNLIVFGIDEVGRGSFAGPIVGCAVSFEKTINKKWLDEINDSKILSPKKRMYLSKKIQKHATYFIESVEIDVINKLGIGKANRLLFKRLIKNISNQYENHHFLIDGRKSLNNKKTKFIIKGDSQSISIAAASIVAKVHRDNLMRDLGKKYQGYNFAKNKGYGTKFHQRAIKKLGLCTIHRKSFNLNKFVN